MKETRVVLIHTVLNNCATVGPNNAARIVALLPATQYRCVAVAVGMHSAVAANHGVVWIP